MREKRKEIRPDERERMTYIETLKERYVKKKRKKQMCKEKEKRQVHGEGETEERQTFKDKDRQINNKTETAL